MADLGNRAAVDAAIDALLDDLAPDGSILPSDHNGLLMDILDTLSNGLSTTLRTGNTTGGFNISVTDGDTLNFEKGAFECVINPLVLTSNRQFDLPDQSGTVALLSDITGGASVYTESNTAFTDVEVTVDNTFNFIGGNLIKKGSDTLGTTTGFQLTDSANVSNWDFRNNGDIYKGKESSIFLGSTDLNIVQNGSGGLVIDGTGGSGSSNLTIKGKNALGTFAIKGNDNLPFFEANASTTFGGASTLLKGALQFGFGATSQGISFFNNATQTDWVRFTGAVSHRIKLGNNPDALFNMESVGLFIVHGTGVVGTEKISLQNDTLIKGSNTLLSTSGLILVDSADTTNWDFRNNGDIHMGKDSTVFFNGNGLTIGAGSTALLGFHGATPVDQATTAITASAFVANTSTIVDDTATFGGYTMGQIAAALIEKGILA